MPISPAGAPPPLDSSRDAKFTGPLKDLYPDDVIVRPHRQNEVVWNHVMDINEHWQTHAAEDSGETRHCRPRGSDLLLSTVDPTLCLTVFGTFKPKLIVSLTDTRLLHCLLLRSYDVLASNAGGFSLLEHGHSRTVHPRRKGAVKGLDGEERGHSHWASGKRNCERPA